VTAASSIGVGVVGLGFMGCTHIRAYAAAAASGSPCRLVAVADRKPERFAGTPIGGNIGSASSERLFDRSVVRTYSDPSQLLADPAVDAVSICTHTDSHVELAAAALHAGKHVLVEKPIALASTEVARLAAVARQTGGLCMPAMCMRFWPGWTWLRAAIRAGTYGRVLSATFQRIGSAPQWSEFYRDTAASGGVLFDTHIHDADFIRWCFGEPEEVVCIGTWSHMTTLYRFAAGPAHVTAEAGLDAAEGFGFRMRFMVVFEQATAELDLARAPALQLHRADRSDRIDPSVGEPPTGYDGEIRAFLRAIAERRTNADLVATVDDAVLTARLLEAERTSMELRAPQRVR
jgi:predicted dehydrogenase